MYTLVLLDSRYGAEHRIQCDSALACEELGHIYEMDDGAEWYYYEED